MGNLIYQLERILESPTDQIFGRQSSFHRLLKEAVKNGECTVDKAHEYEIALTNELRKRRVETRLALQSGLSHLEAKSPNPFLKDFVNFIEQCAREGSISTGESLIYFEAACRKIEPPEYVAGRNSGSYSVLFRSPL